MCFAQMRVLLKMPMLDTISALTCQPLMLNLDPSAPGVSQCMIMLQSLSVVLRDSEMFDRITRKRFFCRKNDLALRHVG